MKFKNMKNKNNTMPDIFLDIKKYLENRLNVKLSNPISMKKLWDEYETIAVGFSKTPEHLRATINGAGNALDEDYFIYIHTNTGKIWFSKLKVETIKTYKNHYYFCDDISEITEKAMS
jgi:hypothetical protein